ncbi:hypothetical protein A616_04150 [Brevibacillus brevis X23]|nr:hypothetical protein A616_04150 [Brevibacillus brevis X23]
MTFDQMILILQEWCVPITTILVILMLMAADLFPKVRIFIDEIEQRYPQGLYFLYQREKYDIDCYERLPVRIRVGFAIIGGKQSGRGWLSPDTFTLGENKISRLLIRTLW